MISSVLIDLSILLVESLCQSVQLMAPVYTPVLYVPEFLVFVRVQTEQLTPVELSKHLQQNIFTSYQYLQYFDCCLNIFDDPVVRIP